MRSINFHFVSDLIWLSGFIHEHFKKSSWSVLKQVVWISKPHKVNDRTHRPLSKGFPCEKCTELDEYKQKCCEYLSLEKRRKNIRQQRQDVRTVSWFEDEFRLSVQKIFSWQTSTDIGLKSPLKCYDGQYFRVAINILPWKKKTWFLFEYNRRRSLSAKLVLWKCNDRTPGKV